MRKMDGALQGGWWAGKKKRTSAVLARSTRSAEEATRRGACRMRKENGAASLFLAYRSPIALSGMS